MKIPALWLGLLWCVCVAAFAQGTAFTYQGSLTDGGQTANGLYDFQFALFADENATAPVGSAVAFDGVSVSNGLFNVLLDFGSAAFDGSSRWVRVSVRNSGSTGGYQNLWPPQYVASAPHAIRAAKANALDGVGVVTFSMLESAAVDAIRQPIVDLQTRFDGTNALVSAKLAALESAIVTLPSGVTAASLVAADPTLTALGYLEFARLPTNPWVNGSSVNAAAARFEHTAVWTGGEFVVWGGRLGNLAATATSASYRPDSDSWTATSTVDAPSARSRHSAVWTGSDMIVWGGVGVPGYLNTGGRYSAGLWRATSATGAPSAREGHTATWTGSGMILFGGLDSGGSLGDAFSYDPVANQWSPIVLANAPSPRYGATAVWTGSSLIVWGGHDDDGPLGDGKILVFSGGTPAAWIDVNSANAPMARSLHTAVWTGSKMVVWGGDNFDVPLGSGGIYDPTTATWSATSMTDAPSERRRHSALWTGAEMLILAGDVGATETNSSYAYDSASDRWRALTLDGSPVARMGAASAWTGAELLSFGGKAANVPVAQLQRLNPQAAWRLYRKP